MSIDAHCHASPVWYEPVETLLFQMDRCGVEKAVLVQILGQFDNSYQQSCLNRFAGRLASVVSVDVESATAPETLQRLADQGARGVRLRPSARSPGTDPLAIWRTADACGLAVSCIGPVAGFASPEFALLCREFPRMPFVLEHLGGLARPDTSDVQTAKALVFALAELPNVYLKLPGLGQLAPRAQVLPSDGLPLPSTALSLIREIVERFGAQRLMWGSDFPPVAAREGYGNALRWVQEGLADLPSAAREMVFSGVANRIFFGTRAG